jgi:HSP20 family protein
MDEFGMGVAIEIKRFQTGSPESSSVGRPGSLSEGAGRNLSVARRNRRSPMYDMMPWTQAGNWMEEMRKEMERAMSRFFGAEPVNGQRLWAPHVDLEETEKEVVLKADLPGVAPKDVEISVNDGILMMRGEKKEEREEKGKGFLRSERFLGRFYREVPLPAGLDLEKVSASVAAGVLTVTIPKVPGAQPRKVVVKAAE